MLSFYVGRGGETKRDRWPSSLLIYLGRHCIIIHVVSIHEQNSMRIVIINRDNVRKTACWESTLIDMRNANRFRSQRPKGIIKSEKDIHV